jgi:replicative DNA helicase
MNEEQKAKADQIRAIDIDNEKIAIGCMLQDEQAAISATKMLQERYFYTEYGRHILKIVKSDIEKGDSVHNIRSKVNSIANEDWQKLAPQYDLKRKDYLDNCYTYAMPYIGLVSAAESAFKKVHEQYLRRTMCREYENAISKILDTKSTKDLQEIVTNISQESNDVLDGAIVSEEHDYKLAILETLNKKAAKPIDTGFNKLDEIIGGLRAGQLITIGAGTGVGKSAFAVNLALNITAQGHKVGLWSFEMDKEEIYQRIISIKTGLSKKDKMVQEERYNSCRKYVDSTNDDIQIFTDRIKDLGNFYLQCRKLSLKKNMKVVIIDYLQLIHLSQSSNGNRVSEIEFLTTNLKNIASELGITIVILSQLSRAYQKRDDKTPMLSDLRDSGSIEQDSNVVIFLHKLEDNKNYQALTTPINIIVAKNRDGASGAFPLQYQGNTTQFIQGVN